MERERSGNREGNEEFGSRGRLNLRHLSVIQGEKSMNSWIELEKYGLKKNIWKSLRSTKWFKSWDRMESFTYGDENYLRSYESKEQSPNRYVHESLPWGFYLSVVSREGFSGYLPKLVVTHHHKQLSIIFFILLSILITLYLSMCCIKWVSFSWI